MKTVEAGTRSDAQVASIFRVSLFSMAARGERITLLEFDAR